MKKGTKKCAIKMADMYKLAENTLRNDLNRLLQTPTNYPQVALNYTTEELIKPCEDFISSLGEWDPEWFLQCIEDDITNYKNSPEKIKEQEERALCSFYRWCRRVINVKAT